MTHAAAAPALPSPADPAAMARELLSRGVDAAFGDVAPGVQRLGVVFVNLYSVDAGGGRWVLVDTGLPGFAAAVGAACDELHDGRPPEAIVLTHAHFDHAGNVAALAERWGVPVYAHRREMPYLDGRSDYAPGDPTPGGAICFLSRFFPHGGYDLRGRVDLRELPGGDDGGDVPGLAGWRWLHTPGHSAGHVSLWRESDRTLVAGDAVATMDLDSWAAQVTRPRELSRPAVPFTPDWPSAVESVRRLSGLSPRTVAAGHGLPVGGADVAGRLDQLALSVAPPPHGRYVGAPARYDAEGRLVDVPPPPPDPLKPRLTVAAGLAVAGAGLAVFAASRRRRG